MNDEKILNCIIKDIIFCQCPFVGAGIANDVHTILAVSPSLPSCVAWDALLLMLGGPESAV